MNTQREDLVSLLRKLGEHDLAFRAACSLPRSIDTERDAGLLKQLDIHPQTLALSVVSPATPA